MVTEVASMRAVDAPFLPDLAEQVTASEPVYGEIVHHLNLEAMLLDRNRLNEWLGLLAADLVYWMPVRLTRDRDDSHGFSTTMGHFDDSFESVTKRVHRFTTTNAVWAENPPSRYRRLVTNVIVYKTAVPGEFLVSSYLLLVRNRANVATNDIISAERQDLVRRTADGFRLARREIYVDQSTLGIQNLAAFL